MHLLLSLRNMLFNVSQPQAVPWTNGKVVMEWRRHLRGLVFTLSLFLLILISFANLLPFTHYNVDLQKHSQEAAMEHFFRSVHWRLTLTRCWAWWAVGFSGSPLPCFLLCSYVIDVVCFVHGNK